MERFEYAFSATTVEPPTGSQIRLDNAAAQAATKMWVRNTTTPGEDTHTLLMAMAVGTRLYVQDYDDHTKYVAFTLSGAPVDKDAYVELPVVWLVSGDPLVNQKVLLAEIAPADVPAPTPAPGTPLPPLCDLDDLKALGITGDAADLNRLIDAASAAARAWCGWMIAPPMANVALLGRYAGKVVTLPTLCLNAVHSVTVDGADVAVPPWMEAGVLQLQIGPFNRCSALVDHGYADVPADVAIATAGMVARVVSAPAGVTGERVGMWSVSYTRGAINVDESAAGGLAPYALPHVP